ncbi:MAG: hypothetical protein S4CHLAM20_14430 [Chlamydiia bacterium]|nr:hypothetical protein [Chlamydiia bacterium]
MIFCLIFCLSGLLFSHQLDVVIPVHKKDTENLDLLIDYVHKNIKDVRKVYVVSKHKFTDKAIWIDEQDYPFSIEDVANELGGVGVGKHIRRGWYYQQLLKFYTYKVIDDLTEDFLILDADTRPNKVMKFIEDDGRVYLDHFACRCLCNEYYKFLNRLVPAIEDVHKGYNPVVHHMVFTKSILDSLFQQVEEVHAKPFWLAFSNCVIGARTLDPRYFYAGASEYLIYFHFCRNFFPEKILLRPIAVMPPCGSITESFGPRYAFVTHHNYDRTE